jgi:hypothetical protein
MGPSVNKIPVSRRTVRFRIFMMTSIVSADRDRENRP